MYLCPLYLFFLILHDLSPDLSYLNDPGKNAGHDSAENIFGMADMPFLIRGVWFYQNKQTKRKDNLFTLLAKRAKRGKGGKGAKGGLNALIYKWFLFC